MDMGMDDGGDWGWDMDEDWDGAMSGVGQSSPDGSDDSESEEENVPRVVDRGSLESPSEERLRPPARQEVVLRDDAAEGRVPRIERVGHSEEEEEEEDSEEEGIAEIPDREEEGSDDGMMADSFTSDEEAVFPPLAPEEEADGGDGEEGEQEDEDGIFSSVSKLYSLVSTGSLSHTSQKRLRHVAQQLQNVVSGDLLWLVVGACTEWDGVMQSLGDWYSCFGGACTFVFVERFTVLPHDRQGGGRRIGWLERVSAV